MIDPVEFGKQMGALVREAVAPLQARIDKLEKSIPAPVSASDVVALIDTGAIAKKVADSIEIDVQPPEPTPTAEQVAATFERRFSDLVLSWERQARDTFERAADRMPIPTDGRDGRDALPLESFDLSLAEDGRTVTVKMQAGETVLEKSLKIASVLDRGVYKSEAEYECGDAVTHGGSLWIAQTDAPEGAPGLGGKGWRLAVKKGRDGKDLRDNASTIDPKKPVEI